MLLGERLDAVQLSGMAIVILGVMTLRLTDPLRFMAARGIAIKRKRQINPIFR